MNFFQKLVYCTTDYASLNHYPFNRPCDVHGAALAKKIKQVNLLQDNPLKCRKEADGKIYILDGQGRHFAAAMLKLPIYYEFVESQLPAVELIKQYNANSKKFAPMDYIHLYSSNGNRNYIRLKSQLIGGLDLTFTAEFLARPGFKSAAATIKDERYQSGCITLKKANALKTIAELTQYYQEVCKKHKLVKSGKVIKINRVLSKYVSTTDKTELKSALSAVATRRGTTEFFKTLAAELRL